MKSGKPFALVESKFNNAPTLTAGTYNAIHDLNTSYNFVITPREEKETITINKNLQLTNIEGLINLPVLKSK